MLGAISLYRQLRFEAKHPRFGAREDVGVGTDSCRSACVEGPAMGSIRRLSVCAEAPKRARCERDVVPPSLTLPLKGGGDGPLQRLEYRALDEALGDVHLVGVLAHRPCDRSDRRCRLLDAGPDVSVL